MVMPPGEAGTYRIHFTGSKEHNVRLRAMARDQGWSLSEKGFLRIGEDGEPLTGDDAELRTFATEEDAYAFLGLPFIVPELREDRGEIEAALAGRLPDLIDLADLRGDLHSHSDWSDGHFPIEVMADHARRRGYAYQVLTDHTQSLAIAGGLTPDRVAQQAEIIAALNATYAAEEAAGTAPRRDPARGLPAAPRLRARDPRRRQPRLRGRPAGPLRRRRRVGPRLASPIARRADPPHPQRHPQSARRRHRPSVGAQDRAARRPRPRLGRGLCGGRPDRDRARDERLAAAARPRRRARASCGLGRLPAQHRFGRALHQGARLRALGDQPGASGMGHPRGRRSTRGRARTSWPGPPRSRSACERLRVPSPRWTTARPRTTLRSSP